jgi:hypothetical protein
MTDDTTPRPRGRPAGARDSYQRTRRTLTEPDPPIRLRLYEALRELIEAAERRGFNRAADKRGTIFDKAVDEAEQKLIRAIAEVIAHDTTGDN